MQTRQLWHAVAAHTRKLYASGGLGPRKGPVAADTGELVAFIARTAAVRCLHAGRLADGLKIYLRELFPQLRLSRWRFLAGFPLLVLRSPFRGASNRRIRTGRALCCSGRTPLGVAAAYKLRGFTGQPLAAGFSAFQAGPSPSATPRRSFTVLA